MLNIRTISYLLLFHTLIIVPCQAFIASPTEIDNALQKAILIADVKVIESRSIQDNLHFARYESEVELLKVIQINDDGGWFPHEGGTFLIEGIGGEVNGIGVMFSGYPRPYKGGKYRVHLKREKPNSFTITGFESGIRDLSPTRQYSRNRTDGSNGDGHGPFLYWDDSFFPIPYYISAPSFAGKMSFIPAIDASFKTWRDIQNIRIEFLPAGCTSSKKNENDGLNSVILVTQNWQFDPVAIAITRNFYIAGDNSKAGLILDSDTMLNAVNHRFTTTNEPAMHDVQNIMTHEVGHFLGLGHEISPLESDATMFSVASPNEIKKRVLHTNDLAGIRSAYSGVGNKYKFWISPSCTAADLNIGCASIHNNNRTPMDLIWIVTFGSILLVLGRLYQKNNSDQTTQRKS